MEFNGETSDTDSGIILHSGNTFCVSLLGWVGGAGLLYILHFKGYVNDPVSIGYFNIYSLLASPPYFSVYFLPVDTVARPSLLLAVIP